MGPTLGRYMNIVCKCVMLYRSIGGGENVHNHECVM